MKKLQMMFIVPTLLCAGCNTMPRSDRNPQDQFVGTYTRIPFIGTYGNVNPEATGMKIQVSKSGEVYHLSGSDTAFVEKAKGVLEDITVGTPMVRRGSLGTITAGQMKFSDQSKPLEVLKAEFAYDHFLLIKDPVTVPPAIDWPGRDTPAKGH